MYNPAQIDLELALKAGLEDSDRMADIPADDFVVSPVDRIRRFFAEQSNVYRPVEDVSAEWERYFRLNSFLEEYGAHFPLFAYVTPNSLPSFQSVHIGLPSFQREGSDQLLFPLEGSFSPSKKLTDIWIQSVKALAADVNTATDIVFASATLDVQHEFTKLLTALFGTVAQQIRYGAPSELNITKGDAFTPTYEIPICDRFLILPSLAAQFLSLLREELISTISEGVAIKGAWGHVGINSSGAL